MTTEIDDINSTRNIAARIRGGLGLITEEEVAAVLLLNSVGTLATWRSQGKGPEAVKLGKRVFYSTAGLAQWINTLNQAQNQPPAPVELQAAA